MSSVKRKVPKGTTGNHSTLPVVEEQLRVGKKSVDKGGFRIVKEVDEKTVVIPLATRSTEYSFERVAVNKYVEEPPPVRYEGNTMILSVVEEEVVVQKRLKLVEELRVTTVEKETLEQKEVILKKERIKVDRIE